jgi:Zn-dependent peptidase ImmA (M78 family)
MHNVPIVLKDLPVDVHGFVCLGSDYEPIIVINSRLSKEKQQLAYDHELKHLKRGEMFNEDYHEYGGIP